MEKLEENKLAFRLFFLFAVLPTPAYAYLDPGTGSMLVSVIIGIIASVYFTLKNIYYGFSRGAVTALGMKWKKKKPLSIVFYSEGGQYWNTFKPVIAELIHRQIACTYFTQDQTDSGLDVQSPYYSCEFIGIGNKGYFRMNYLHADICVMTTPGLDVLQIKRSTGVRHYVHLVHAPTDMGTYKLFSFDYYDSVFISGPHQKKSLRFLEKLRRTHAKRICAVGCTYYDEMLRDLQHLEKKPSNPSSIPTVLIAPTWGKNGLFHKYGTEIVISLLSAGYRVMVRPHPQSYISEKEMIQSIEDALKDFDNLVWSREPDGLKAMSQADILLSDLSGIIFDFAFLFFKPVITLQFTIEKRGAESNDLPYEPWELGVLNIIGKQISKSDIPYIDKIVCDCLKKENHADTIVNLRNESVMNFGNAASAATDQLIEIAKSLHNDTTF